MIRSHILRLLRIAVTVMGLIMCVALIVMWVRSFGCRDVIGGKIWSHVIAIESADGKFAVMSYYLNPTFSTEPWGVTSYDHRSKGFGTRITPEFVVEYWALLLLSAALSGLPWIHHIGWGAKLSRFTLRDVFIFTTLVAVVLGLIVAMR